MINVYIFETWKFCKFHKFAFEWVPVNTNLDINVDVSNVNSYNCKKLTNLSILNFNVCLAYFLLKAGLREVIIYTSPDDKKKNRGFCFLEYESHKSASLAKRRLETGRVKVWSCDIIVDWADPQEEPDENTMAQVKVLYVRNLTQVRINLRKYIL